MITNRIYDLCLQSVTWYLQWQLIHNRKPPWKHLSNFINEEPKPNPNPTFIELEPKTNLLFKVLRIWTEPNPYHQRTSTQHEPKILGSFISLKYTNSKDWPLLTRLRSDNNLWGQCGSDDCARLWCTGGLHCWSLCNDIILVVQLWLRGLRLHCRVLIHHLPARRRMTILTPASNYNKHSNNYTQLLQTDGTSALVVDRVKMCLTSSFITIGKLVIVFHTVCAHVRCSKKFGDAGVPPSWKIGVADHLELCFSLTCVTTSNLVFLGQTIRV